MACLIASRDWHHFIAHGYIHHTVAIDNISFFIAGIICEYVQCRSRLAVHVCFNFCRCKVKLNLAARNLYATCLINVKNVALRPSMAKSEQLDVHNTPLLLWVKKVHGRCIVFEEDI